MEYTKPIKYLSNIVQSTNLRTIDYWRLKLASILYHVYPSRPEHDELFSTICIENIMMITQ